MNFKYNKIFVFVFLILIFYNSYIKLPKIYEDITQFDKYNTSEEKVINAHYFSSYKGSFILKVSIGSNAFSYGVIFLGDEVNDKNSLKHEYGHYLQLKEFGLIKYTRYIVLPSLVGYWGGVEYDKYYSQPWEYGADLYGGVERNNYKYDSNVLENYIRYFDSFKKR